MIHDLLIQNTGVACLKPMSYLKVRGFTTKFLCFIMFPGCYDGFSIGVAARIFFVYLQAAQQRGGTNCCHARL